MYVHKLRTLTRSSPQTFYYASFSPIINVDHPLQNYWHTPFKRLKVMQVVNRAPPLVGFFLLSSPSRICKVNIAPWVDTSSILKQTDGPIIGFVAVALSFRNAMRQHVMKKSLAYRVGKQQVMHGIRVVFGILICLLMRNDLGLSQKDVWGCVIGVFNGDLWVIRTHLLMWILKALRQSCCRIQRYGAYWGCLLSYRSFARRISEVSNDLWLHS